MFFLRLRAVLSAGLVLASLLIATRADAQRPRVATPDAFEAPDGYVRAPLSGSFVYDVTRTVDQGRAAYDGYTDSLHSAGTYRIEGEAESDIVRIHADYSWRYFGAPCDDGHEVREVIVSESTRHYAGRTDLDDFDDKPGILATWLWVPTSLTTGDTIQILDRTFTCQDGDQGLRAEVITLQATYEEHRIDGYGDYLYQTVDTYHFDARTGFFLDEHVVERASGTTEGAFGTFVMTTDARATSATYLGDGVVYEPLLPGRCGAETSRQAGGQRDSPDWAYLGRYAVPLSIVFFAFVLPLLRRNRTRSRFEVSTLSTPEVTPEMTGLTPSFGPFLRHFMVVAAKTKDPVYTAKSRDNKALVGLAFVDRETKLGTVFTRDADACEELRRAIGVEDFFSEVQHTALPSVERASGLAKPAYNTLETYDVLVRTSSESPAYDPDVVMRAKPSDRDAILALSLLVHGVRGQAWWDASIEAGDLAFVARIDGNIVGFAMLTVQGAHGRLHTNTVHPDFRGRGVGKEFARARIHTALALGATQLLTEVATWNVASLEVVRSLGFEKKSAMYVSTARNERIEKKALRR